jgi:hypothetical protein
MNEDVAPLRRLRSSRYRRASAVNLTGCCGMGRETLSKR